MAYVPHPPFASSGLFPTLYRQTGFPVNRKARL